MLQVESAGWLRRQTDRHAAPPCRLRSWEQPREKLFAFSEPGVGVCRGGGVSAVFRRCCCFNQLKDGFETVDVTMFGKVFTSASQPLRRHMEVGRGREDAAEEITHVRNFANTGS